MTKPARFLTLMAASALLALSGCAANRAAMNYAEDDQSFVDDGTDYYSAEAQTDEPLSIYREQWIIDEDGNRIYTMNTHEALGDNRYYVGDIRYLPSRQDNERQPLYFDRWGNPVYQLNGSYVGNSGRHPYGYARTYPSGAIQIVPPQSSVATSAPPAPTAPVTRPAPVSRPAPSRVRDYRRMEAPRQRPRSATEIRRRSD